MSTSTNISRTTAGRPWQWTLAAVAAWGGCAAAQTGAQPALPAPPTTRIQHWQQCDGLQHDAAARLACYDQWAAQQRWQQEATPEAATFTAPATAQAERPPAAASARLQTEAEPDAQAPLPPTLVVAAADGCRNPAFDRSARMWELDSNTDCGNFRFRGYRPLTIGLAWGDHINRQPYSSGPENGLGEYRLYQHQEARIQLSVRTKLASNLLTQNHATKRDSLWFGYTLEAYWQSFNRELSRPFRNTDHQPELLYVYPLEWRLPGQARIRYAGLGLNHQSNGQSNPLSRSWNRYYAMLGVDLNPSWSLQARVWKRLREDAARDDNPGISDYIGRAELSAQWEASQNNSLALTLRHSLRSDARGSARLEWYHALGEGFAGGKSNLRLYTGIFHGYGDSLIDYNHRRTVLTLGLSLLDF